MDQKKVIEKLVKIAENQQKIISKLAQQVGLTPEGQPLGGAADTWDVSGEVSGVLAQIPEAKHARAGIQSATLGSQSGYLDVKVQFPSVKDMGTPAASAVEKKLSAALQGKSFAGKDGKQLAAQQVKVTGVYG